MATIKLTNVKKIYENKVTAVHNFNLDIKDKEFIVFVGPSGCGKSTTLRMIAGLEEISEGTVEIDGVIVNDLQPKDRDIAMVFQNYALYPHLTVYENMAFPLRIKRQPMEVPLEEKDIEKLNNEIAKKEALIEAHGEDYKYGRVKADLDELKEKLHKGTKIIETKMKNNEIYDKVTSVSEILGITEYLTRKPRALSGGQRQRVAIGRAMVRDSKVFLMDEPLSNLDAKLRNQMRAEIIQLRDKINSTFIYVTHDQTEAMTLGDRIVIMKDGYIMQVGSPTEVFDMPANLFVAEFIGAPKMNTFEAELVKNGKDYSVNCLGYTLPVGEEKSRELEAFGAISQSIILGIRPEHIQYDKNGKLEATIEVNEMMGSEVHLHVLVNNQRLIIRIPTMNLSKEERLSLVAGNKIRFNFEGKAMHFFNLNTHKNLLVKNHEDAPEDELLGEEDEE